MAGLPPGDPQLVSMIVSHLKTQGLFDQFRRECLADVDTKPAYLNLKQRVDNFVSNHLSNHTWSPHLNKNQLRNNIRQLVLQSGMLEQGVDRIVAQVVDPKINHIFRPQVERVVREFLSPGSCSEEPPAPLPSIESKPDSSIPEQASTSAPTAAAASDAMSILDTITSLNQEASVRASSEPEKGRKGSDEPMELEESEQDMGIIEEGVDQLEEAEEEKMTSELDALEVKTEDTQEQGEVIVKEELIGEVKMEEEEPVDHEQKGEEKATGKTPGKPSEEKQDDEQLKSPFQAKQKAKERMKEEYFLEDSDLEGLSDITVSSVHTSDLSSFEGQSDDEQMLSDSSEEGELPPDDKSERAERKRSSGDTGEDEKEFKPRRKAYVHKPFLYSRYYSDSDDEITVEERRRSAAKDKEERLLKRQQNRERMEEKRKQKAAQAEEQSHKKQKRGDSAGLEGPRAKEARKERKVLEKKMALSRRRKLDSRKEGDVLSKKKGDTGGESFRKVELKSTTSKTPLPKLIRNLSESASSEEIHRRTSGSISEDSSEPKKLCDKPLTHSFILDLEQGSQEALKQRSGKFDRLSRKEVHIKERKEKERSLSDERAKLKQKQEKKSEHQADETQQKEGVKILSEEKGEKKPKIKSEKKITANTREGKISEGVADGGPKDVKKVKTTSTEAAKAEKDKEKDKMREKDKGKEKDKLKGEKTFAKSDFKPLQRPESAGSSEDRSDMDPGSDSSKKKHSKEVLKRSKSHSEDKQGDKPKSKTDSKEIDKEKTKADQDRQKSNKSNSEPEKDPKRVKPTEKGTTVEKVKAKSKEETKTLLSKTDKKVQNSDAKSVAGASTSKPETTKEKKKERNAKEQRKVSEEPSQEKSEVKSGKKKLEKDKIPEKNNESQEEKKEPAEEKLERSDKSSVSSPSLETEETPKKQPLLRDTSADSDPITATVTTSFSDDTCDALSDITSEASEGDTDSQLCEVPAVPAQADALLTLMDVCTSAEARLPPECFREDVSSERALEDADMKMKEAALTLLSMDPDSTVPSSFIIHNTSDEPVVNETAPQPTPTPAVQEEEHPPVDVDAAETEFTTTEASPAPPPHTAELVEGNPNTAENSEREMESEVKISEKLAPQNCQDSLEDEAKKAEILPEAQLEDEPSPPAVDEEAAVFKPENVKGNTEENTGYSVCTTDKVSETSVVSSNDEQMEPDVTDTEMNPKTEDMAEENLTNADNSEAESTKVEEEHVSEMCEPQSMETSVPDKNEEASEGGPDMQSKLMKPIRSVSSVDSQDDEKGSELSEKEEKTEGRGRRKRKLSSQEVAAVTEFSDERDEEGNEQPSAEETEQTQVVEVNSACRGQSPRTTDETEKDQLDQLEEPSSQNGRRPGAAAKEAIADNQNEDENKQEESSSGEPAENEEGIQEEITTKTSEEQGSQIRLSTPAQEDTEAAGSSESENIADTPQPAVKRRRSEEMEESVEETHVDKEVKEADSQQEPSEQPPQTDVCGLSSGSPSKEQEDAKEESSVENKLDDGIKTEEEQQQEDQEATPKRNVRRGRPPKAAAAAKEDSDKKDKKVERKEGEQNDDEEEEDGEEGKDAATRATTRLASRLEAERNKPSKPSTRASRQSGKDETAAGTRGTRGQAAAAKGGRKREASPPAVRTRGGQKSEEPPSKRGKR